MKGKICLIGAGQDANSALLLQTMKEKFGEDIILVTPEEAQKQGLKTEDFINAARIKIEAPPIVQFADDYKIEAPPIVQFADDYKTGKERRRIRRKNERKANKNR